MNASTPQTDVVDSSPDQAVHALLASARAIGDTVVEPVDRGTTVRSLISRSNLARV